MGMYGLPKDTVELPNGVSIHRTTTGSVWVEAPNNPQVKGQSRAIESDADAQWFFYSVKGEFPAPPRSMSREDAIKLNDEIQERVRAEKEQAKALAEGMEFTGPDGKTYVMTPKA